jgi:hypothetical protein
MELYDTPVNATVKQAVARLSFESRTDTQLVKTKGENFTLFGAAAKSGSHLFWKGLSVGEEGVCHCYHA